VLVELRSVHTFWDPVKVREQIELLRLTRMPTVRVELGYLSSPIDRPLLVDPRFRDTVAEGLLVAVQRLYLPLSDDFPTGVMRIPAGVGPDG